jgi:hypothetical protein
MAFVSSKISRIAFGSQKISWFQSSSEPFKSMVRPGAYFSSKSDAKDADKVEPVNPDGAYDYGYGAPDERFRNGKPTLAYAKAMPYDFSSMRHEQILQLSAEGIAGARREALTRNIMSVDDVDYESAKIIMAELEKVNRQWVHAEHLPYSVGLGVAVVSGFASFPLVFHLDTVASFNEKYVTADIPEPKDLETWLEVGSWSWAWMEPVLGQASFALLVAQFARSQMINLGIKPYGNFVKNLRAKRLVKLYPQYDANFVHLYSVTDKLFNDNE